MHGSTEDQQPIIELLVRGWSDERISRTLALSERTVQRRVRRLMQEYDCTSRFALGFALGRTFERHQTSLRNRAGRRRLPPAGCFT